MAYIKLPGLIDPHVHLRDPGETEKEDFFTGTNAALTGGYTTVLDMPNNKEPIFSFAKLQEKISIAKTKTVANVGFYFGSQGDNIEDFPKVYPFVFGLKLYLNQTTGNFLVDDRRLQIIFGNWDTEKGGPILIHAEDVMVEKIVELVKQTGKQVHFCHISTKHDLQLILLAKKQRLPITCGVTPHHLFLTDDDAKKLGNFGLVKPPLASQEDQNFLWANLYAIDVIESDHAPHTKEQKQENKLYGFPGLETSFLLLLTALAENRISLDDIKRLCIENPARIFGIQNYSENEIEVDLNEEHIISNGKLHTKSAWSPFAGRRVKGKVIKAQIKGVTVFANDTVLAKPGSGEVLQK